MIRSDRTVTVSTEPAPSIDLEHVNRQLESCDAVDVIKWAAEMFGSGLLMTSSFGAQSAVMLHLATRVQPDIPIIFIDTGYLFPETYVFADELKRRLDLNLHIYHPAMTAARQEALYGKLWETDEKGLARYHQINKIEPMQRAIRELKPSAWLAGLRRQQTSHRASLRHVELQDGIYKVHPILKWSNKDVYDYLKKYELPYHPLYYEGYASIGDWHSTRPITDEQNERDGRFHGKTQECGLHIPSTEEETQSRDASGL